MSTSRISLGAVRKEIAIASNTKQPVIYGENNKGRDRRRGVDLTIAIDTLKPVEMFLVAFTAASVAYSIRTTLQAKLHYVKPDSDFYKLLPPGFQFLWETFQGVTQKCLPSEKEWVTVGEYLELIGRYNTSFAYRVALGRKVAEIYKLMYGEKPKKAYQVREAADKFGSLHCAVYCIPDHEAILLAAIKYQEVL